MIAIAGPITHNLIFTFFNNLDQRLPQAFFIQLRDQRLYRALGDIIRLLARPPVVAEAKLSAGKPGGKEESKRRQKSGTP